MAKTPDIAAALPGDLVQITDPQDKWHMAILVVEEARRWGLKTHALVPTPTGVQPAYYRIAHGKFAKVGTAALVDREIAQARETMIATIREAKG